MNHILASIVFYSVLCVTCFGQNPSQYFTDSIYSENLKEYRLFNVYLPKNYDSDLRYPVIFKTDGGKIENAHSSYSLLLDSLIDNNRIKPIVLIEEHCNQKIAEYAQQGKSDSVAIQYRNYEYVKSNSDHSSDSILSKTFDNHLHFFIDEFIPTTTTKYHLSNEKSMRHFYGTSNGAGFGVFLFNTNPDIIGTYICYSTLGSNTISFDRNTKLLQWAKKTAYPTLYLKYGSLEPEFFKTESEAIVRKCKKTKIDYHLSIYDGGHDQNKWLKEFEKQLIQLFEE